MASFYARVWCCIPTPTGRVIDLAHTHTQTCHWASDCQWYSSRATYVTRCFPNIQQSLGLCQLLLNNPIQHGDKRVQTDGKISDDLAVKRLPKYWWENGFKEGLPYWGLQEDPTPNTPNSGLEPQARWTGVDTAPWAGTALGRTCNYVVLGGNSDL